MAWDPKDLSALVHASCWTLLFVATIFCGTRFYSRLRITAVGFQADDWILLVGWSFMVVATGILSRLMVEFMVPGSRSKITLARVHHNLQSIALGLTKTSFGITLLRLMPGGWEAKVIWGLLITMNLQFAVHIIATWQQICGASDQGHIGTKCWELHQSVTFTVFSAVYSALCDFILAVLPWKMIFNLQMKQSERMGVALALSMGILAGVTGVMKAYQGYILLDILNPNYLYEQAVYWIWSMAEPNVTIISASIPVLRGFVRNVRNRTDSSPGTGGYVRTGDDGSRIYNRSTVTAMRSTSKDQDGASDTSILGKPVDGDGGKGGGIMWTTEINVEYEPRFPTGGGRQKNIEEHELEQITALKD